MRLSVLKTLRRLQRRRWTAVLDPDVKRALARAIVRRLDGWTQENAAYLIRDDAPRVSDLRFGKLDRFSAQRLIVFLTRLHADVEIRIRPVPRVQRQRPRPGRVTVVDEVP